MMAVGQHHGAAVMGIPGPEKFLVHVELLEYLIRTDHVTQLDLPNRDSVDDVT